MVVMVLAAETSSTATCLPSRLVSAIMHAETRCWQAVSQASVLYSLSRPMPPQNVYVVPYWSALVKKFVEVSAHLARYFTTWRPAADVISPSVDERPL